MRIAKIFSRVKLLVYGLSDARATAGHDDTSHSFKGRANILRLSGYKLPRFPLEVFEVYDENRAEACQLHDKP